MAMQTFCTAVHVNSLTCTAVRASIEFIRPLDQGNEATVWPYLMLVERCDNRQ